ncbi:MAG TPA: anaerobic ribonucleoside-triphosphate reductase activating protein [Lachnospiraceae bacterium]
MNYSAIKYCDIANGTGVRTVLFVSGCRNRCEGCFQPKTWDFSYGFEFTKDVEEKILKSLEPSYIAGLTVLGGEPFEEENQKVLLPFLKRVRCEFPKKSIWAYTGYIFDKDLKVGGRKYTENTRELLSCLDVLVDGPFDLQKKNLMLKFRGSENQRLIDVRASLRENRLILWGI